MQENKLKNIKLKWSRFNFLFDSSEHGKLLYNSYNNAFIKLDVSLYELFSAFKLSRNIIKHELSDKELDYFIKTKIFVKNDEDLVEQMHYESLHRIYDKKHLVLTIAPTQYCNFSCTYCYEKWRTPGRMSDETADAIIAHLENQKKRFGLETISLTWYGGEPLLESERILKLGRRINELGVKIIENDIITNGYLFNDNNIASLVELKVDSVQITLDGFKEVHDIRRPLLSGKGTFDRIIHNLDKYYSGENSDKLTIALRVNIDKSNKSSYLEIYSWLKERYPSEKMIVYPGWIHLDENDEKKCDCFSRNESTDFCFDLCKNHDIISENLYPDDINMECMTRNPNSMIVGWQGEIYKCYEDLGNEDLVVGNINYEKIWTNHELISKYAVGIDHYQDPICRKCSYLPICYGGCPIRRLENKYEGKSNDCCTPFKGRLEEFLNLQYERSIKGKVIN